MAQFKMEVLVPILLLVLMAMAAEATPPGIAKNPSNARCLIKKYKHCYNLVHVCPKFCPDQCTVECVSCKPICSGGSSPAPVTTPTPSPTPPTPEYYSPPPPIATPSPPPPAPSTPSPTPPTPTPPPSPPPPTPHYQSPPPTPTPSSPSPPTPSPPTPSSPPPTTPSSPPPSVPSFTPSSPPPSTPTPSPTTPSPPPSTPSPTPPTNPASPPPSTPSSAPPSSTPSKAKCKNKNYPQCYNIQHVCPSACPGGCEVDCVTCKPVCKCDQPGAVCQDPRFVGGDGITFYFHGKKDNDFCLLSDSNLHINAHFIGRRNHNMRRDFTWVQSIAILFGKHQLFLGAQKTATWDDSIDRLALSFDGEPIALAESEGAKWQSTNVPTTVSLTRVGTTNNVMVEVEGSFRITAKVVPITEQESRVHNYGITKDDTFAHLDLGFKFFSLSNQVDGVLGQTYRPNYVSRVNIGANMPVMGGDMEFRTSSLFATDCAIARFNGGNVGSGSEANALEGLEFPSLSCASGMDGRGVVCKR